ncbi:MAG: SDR family NAD(P)-dependent oxidoreductase [Flavobacteriia bacterium]|nr:SDR family NAD(P)-dependent oxidoreductase [Flavobacteriia bacterium]
MKKNKNILIVGASGGIGTELLYQSIENKNTNVYALVRKIGSLDKLQKKHQNLHPIYLDLEDKNYKKKLENSLINVKQIELCIFNAGYLHLNTFLNLNSKEIEKSFQINAFAPLYTAQVLLPKMLKKGGHIVQISTMGAIQGSVKFSGLTAYSGSKSVMCNLTELFAEEHKDTLVRMNCLCLGAVQTEMLKKAFPDFQAIVKPKEMAQFILHFAFESHKFINGKIIPVSLSTP